MATILITGGSGLIGSALTKRLLLEGHTVRWLSRSAGMHGTVQAYAWDLDASSMDAHAIAGVDHIIHLAGAGIAEVRWSEARTRVLIESRTRGPELLHRTCERAGHWPKTFISAAGTGYYGAVTGDHTFTEEDGPGTDTIARISVAWELSVDQWQARSRVVKLRTPMVLARDAGALKPLARLARFGLASAVGSGKQIMPWVHIDDLVSAYVKAMNDPHIMGAYNIVAAHQPDNRTFMRTLASTLHRPLILPAVPATVLRWVVGDVADILLHGSAVSNSKAISAGFQFGKTRLADALKDLYPD